MKVLARTLAVLGTTSALAFAPLTAAHAAPPFSCNGSPEVPDAYLCIVRFQVGADPVPGSQPVNVPGETVGVPATPVNVPGRTVVIPATPVTVPGQTVTVPAQSQHILQLCAGPTGFCVGPFDPSTPAITQTTPGVTQTLPGFTQSVPGVSQTIPGVSETTPPVTGSVPTLSINVPPGAILVLWYKGKCTYVYPNGTTGSQSSALPDGCA
jgi:hypothetical protein